jgi:heterodisulfide reductase subunit B
MQGWLCCGAVLSNVDDNLITKAGPNRILARAQRDGNTLITLCAGCYNVLKRTDLHARQLSSTQQAINLFNEETFNGGVDVVHFLEILRDRIGFDAIERAIKVPLKRLPVGAYYGCLLLRPSGEMKFDDPNRPSILENLLVRLGCEAVDYPARTDCCGSYLSVGSPENIQPLSQSIINSARASGAKLLAVSCPLCKYNLEVCQTVPDYDPNQTLQVIYFTQLLGIALGLDPKDLALDARQTQTILENQTPTNLVNNK